MRERSVRPVIAPWARSATIAANGAPRCAPCTSVPPISTVHGETIIDAQIRFTPSDRFEFYLGVDNLFDNAPPFISVFLANVPGVNTDAGTYDAIGRRFYAGARVRF